MHPLKVTRHFSSGTPARVCGRSGFTLLETLFGLAIIVIGFLGSLAMVLHAGRLTTAAEEEDLAWSGLEQRFDQLRLLEWHELTSTTGVPTLIWTARPISMAGITVGQETITLTGYDVPTAKTLTATWTGTSTPTASFTGSGPELNTAAAVKVVAKITWTGRRSGKQQTRTGVTVISRGGISKSVLP